MSDVVIRVEDLSKKYIIGHSQQRGYKTLREAIASSASSLKHLLHNQTSKQESQYEEFWALKDVSFEVKRGEVIGIIGRNGAGKSTLLKILSRITEPTTGEVRIKGRIASLLEVGTGFHPELTGRENIFLNGAILGMRKTDIKRRFDEIVDFAEVEKFIDTPVKHYSSGMYMRLAFAVAAHLQPEILLIDEVLAVGDIEFQKKCIGKMEIVAKEGRTVLVVSHSMVTVKALCSRAVLLDAGEIKEIGSVDNAIAKYIGINQPDIARKIIKDEDHIMGFKEIRVKSIELINGIANSFSVYWKQSIQIRLEIDVIQDIRDVAFGASIQTINGTPIFTVQHDDTEGISLWDFEVGLHQVDFTIKNILRPGLYRLHIGADREHIRMRKVFCVEAVNIEVLQYNEKDLISSVSNGGFVNGASFWSCEKITS